jgi:hypothetical protein
VHGSLFIGGAELRCEFAEFSLVHRSKVIHSITSPARASLSVWRVEWQHGRAPERSTTLGGSP